MDEAPRWVVRRDDAPAKRAAFGSPEQARFFADTTTSWSVSSNDKHDWLDSVSTYGGPTDWPLRPQPPIG